ncbi:hypothetical protein NEHOM01_1774 [Nematocida homosporus]|uniref:uncharacterized protein n=1 Tax=Nematocida homosporus TaxID=1912981 RepID=UPI0022210F8B|nr:uncharacterized protein NEHOM01_1774 [Nematocida homosporus]KAI5186885.1 hypothetical protein NEHOM01_1774 [Nematocida homosporus]
MTISMKYSTKTKRTLQRQSRQTTGLASRHLSHSKNSTTMITQPAFAIAFIISEIISLCCTISILMCSSLEYRSVHTNYTILCHFLLVLLYNVKSALSITSILQRAYQDESPENLHVTILSLVLANIAPLALYILKNAPTTPANITSMIIPWEIGLWIVSTAFGLFWWCVIVFQVYTAPSKFKSHSRRILALNIPASLIIHFLLFIKICLFPPYYELIKPTYYHTSN